MGIGALSAFYLKSEATADVRAIVDSAPDAPAAIAGLTAHAVNRARAPRQAGPRNTTQESSTPTTPPIKSKF